MPLIDSNGKTWDTKFTKRSRDMIRDWEFEIPVPPDAETGVASRKVKLGVDVTDLQVLTQLQLNIDDQFEVLAAWFWPQWKNMELKVTEAGEEIVLKGRKAFDEICTPEFCAEALKALEEHALRFFSGPVGTIAISELRKAQNEYAAKTASLLRQSLTTILNEAGSDTPARSDSESTPTT